MGTVFRKFISYAEDVEANRAALAEYPCGKNMLITPLSTAGGTDITAYISSGFVDDTIDQVLGGLIQPTKAVGLIIENKDPFVMMEELGLTLHTAISVKETL